MRVVHIIPNVGHTSYGTGPVALNFAKQQQLLSLHSEIWCQDTPDEVRWAADTCGLSERSITGFRYIGPTHLAYSPDMERAATSELGQSFDIMHQHSMWTAVSRVANTWQSVSGKPRVFSPHGSLSSAALARSRWAKRVAMALWDAENMRNISCVHVTSSQEAEDCRRFGLKSPLALIPLGVPDEWINSQGDRHRFLNAHALPSDKRILLFLSRVHPHKGLSLLVKAMAEIGGQAKDWLLVIAGPEQLGHRKEIEQIAEQLGLSNCIRFVENLFGQDKRDAFEAAELFILPSQSENFAFVVAEALGAGVPVITTKGTPWQELITHRCGWWADTTISGIADALTEGMSTSSEELHQAGARGRELVARNYTWGRSAAMIVQVYKWLLGTSERPDCVLEA